MRRLLTALPSYALNGLEVSLGIGLLHAGFDTAFGTEAAQLMMAGAVSASLADTPTTVARAWPRLLLAALLAAVATVVVALLQPHPAGLVLGIGVLAFVAMMTLAWGLRAGPVSFAPVLALVFGMAMPAGLPWAPRIGWPVLGALAYVAWGLLTTWLLQPAYRTLALDAAVRSTATLLRARAALLHAPADEVALRDWVGEEGVLAERLQAARDLLFAATPRRPRVRREQAVLLHMIDMRDLLLASRLDLDRVGGDEAGRALREWLAHELAQLAGGLDEVAQALRRRRTPRAAAPPAAAPDPRGFAAADPRRALRAAFERRLQRLHEHLHGMAQALQGDGATLPLPPAQLALFVRPEGWPLAALRGHLGIDSPVLRHALRSALALAAACAIGYVTPWGSHPHWLVLGVAVVLRGNLQQTLSRRDARVAGTLLGCLLVLLLAKVPPVQHLTFLVCVGIAHAFVNQRYLLTSIAATLMALLQAHFVDPAAGFAVTERLADTVLGAALAWAFSYVLPSWERRSLPRTLAATLRTLQAYGQQALAAAPADEVAPRLARLRAYEALGALSQALQRSRVEPAQVRVPATELARLLDPAHRLMAHLSVVRMMLAADVPNAAQQELAAARDAVRQALALPFEDGDGPPPGGSDGSNSSDGSDGSDVSDGSDGAPRAGPSEMPLPADADPAAWLRARLQHAVFDARQVRQAARTLLAAMKPPLQQ